MLPTLLQADSGGGVVGPQLLLFAVIFGIFYFIVFRPMRKRQRETEAMLGSLERGARVVTTGGIHGTIAGIQGDIVQLKVTDSVKLQVSKTAVASVVDKNKKTPDTTDKK